MARPPDMDADRDGRPSPNRRSESDRGYGLPPAPRPVGWRAAVSRDGLLGRARAYWWLPPLTVLIWVYAEREQVLQTTVGQVPVTLRTAVPNRFVEFAGPSQDQVLTLKLSGPHDAVDRVKAALYTPHGLEVDVGPRVPLGRDQRVSVVGTIGDLPLFRNAGVTVTESTPADLAVNVDTIVTRQADVKRDPAVTNLADESTFDPPTVTVEGPAQQMDHLAQYEGPANGRLLVYADLSGFQADLSKPGERRLDAVPIAPPAAALPPGGGQVRVTPQHVHATLTVRAADVPLVLPSVAIDIKGSQVMWHDCDVKVNGGDLTIRNLHVTGPADQIQAIADKQADVSAVVDVRPDDVGQPEQVRPLTYVLPKGVSVAAEDAGRTVRVLVTKRE